MEGVDEATCDGSVLRVTVRECSRFRRACLIWLREHGYRCSHIASQRADLETVFLTLTGRSVRNA